MFNKSAASSEPRKQIKLKLRGIDIWSATKAGFFVSLAAAIGIIVGALLFWVVLTFSGLLNSLGGILSSLLGGDGNLAGSLSLPSVLVTALTISLLNMVLTTSLAAVYAALFNVIAKLSGGISLTFTNN
ncbi:MAG: DUF3566 domain-containing protein [Aquiluna sp.]|jgi:hypothetical protein